MTTALRPLSTGELLDRTFSLYRSHFGLFIGIFALPNLIVLAFQCAGIALQTTGDQMGKLLVTFVFALGAFVLTLILSAAAQAATVVAVSDVHLDRPSSVKDSFRRVGGHIIGVIFVTILMFLGVMAGCIAFIVPGILLALMWSLSIPVKVLEGKGVIDSMSRSSDLTRGDRGRIFLIWLLVIVLTIGVTLLIDWPVQLAAIATGGKAGHVSAAWQVAVLAADFVSRCLVGPLATIAFSLVYYDERVRKEAFDLQLMMTTIDGATLPNSPAQVGA